MRRHRALAVVLFAVTLALTPVGVTTAGGAGATGQVTAAPAVGSTAVDGVDTTRAASGVTAADCEFPVTATDATGTTVTVEERPARVTTLNPSAAQTMWEIGGRDQVVGVSKFATYLEGADERTNISTGGFGGPSVEKVVGTNPDLVLAPNIVQNETVEKLRDAGLTVFKFSLATSIDDVRAKTSLTGELTGNCAGAADANAWMTANVETVREAVADAERPDVVYPLGGGFVAGDQTFITQMITAAGGQNVLADDVTGYKEVSSEVIVSADPDVVVFTENSAYLAGQSPYTELTAVRENQTVTVNANWLNQPAPRSVVLAVRSLARGFHPDAVADTTFPSRSAATATPTVTPTPTETASPTPTADGEATADEGTATPTTGGEETATSTPGFGLVVAVVGLVAATLVARRRN